MHQTALEEGAGYYPYKGYEEEYLMSEIQSIQWFPGHMTKTKRKIQDSLKLVEAVVEIIDARIPVSSRNPDLDQLVQS